MDQGSKVSAHLVWEFGRLEKIESRPKLVVGDHHPGLLVMSNVRAPSCDAEGLVAWRARLTRRRGMWDDEDGLDVLSISVIPALWKGGDTGASTKSGIRPLAARISLKY